MTKQESPFLINISNRSRFWIISLTRGKWERLQKKDLSSIEIQGVEFKYDDILLFLYRCNGFVGYCQIGKLDNHLHSGSVIQHISLRNLVIFNTVVKLESGFMFTRLINITKPTRVNAEWGNEILSLMEERQIIEYKIRYDDLLFDMEHV